MKGKDLLFLSSLFDLFVFLCGFFFCKHFLLFLFVLNFFCVEILNIDVSPSDSNLVAMVGEGGDLNIYDYRMNTVVKSYEKIHKCKLI